MKNDTKKRVKKYLEYGTRIIGELEEKEIINKTYKKHLEDIIKGTKVIFTGERREKWEIEIEMVEEKFQEEKRNHEIEWKKAQEEVLKLKKKCLDVHMENWNKNMDMHVENYKKVLKKLDIKVKTKSKELEEWFLKHQRETKKRVEEHLNERLKILKSLSVTVKKEIIAGETVMMTKLCMDQNEELLERIVTELGEIYLSPEHKSYNIWEN